ncbi:hypothetical protein T12_15432 [Trichinella patagoniensis]|uniref:Uncharacterized protein n=1 Tax=Trichinella patagoniensis TaxID=990121 RepID=A0A0V1A0G4_9BILA|nr:hypothetical protein T12_15432 [Trichinella patagoniensis]
MVNPRSCAIWNYSDYWIFEKNGKIAFDMYPVLICMCNNVVPVPDRKAMSIEEMEEHFERRQNDEAPNTFPDQASISQNEMVDSSPATVHAESKTASIKSSADFKNVRTILKASEELVNAYGVEPHRRKQPYTEPEDLQ